MELNCRKVSKENLIFNISLSLTDEIIYLLKAYSELINLVPKSNSKKRNSNIKNDSLDKMANECYRIVDILMNLKLRTKLDVKKDNQKEYSNFLDYNNSNPDLEINYNDTVKLINFLLKNQQILSSNKKIKKNELDNLNNELNNKISLFYELSINKFSNYNLKNQSNSISNQQSTSDLFVDQFNFINESSINISSPLNSIQDNYSNTIDNQSDLINESSNVNLFSNSIKYNLSDLFKSSNTNSLLNSIKNNQSDSIDESSNTNSLLNSIENNQSDSIDESSNTNSLSNSIENEQLVKQSDLINESNTKSLSSPNSTITLDDSDTDEMNNLTIEDLTMDCSTSDIEIIAIKQTSSINPIIAKEINKGKYVFEFKNINQLLDLKIDKLNSESFKYYDEQWNINLFSNKSTKKDKSKYRYLTIGLKRINEKIDQDKIKVDFQFTLFNKKFKDKHKIFDNCVFESHFTKRIWLEDNFISYNDLKTEFILDDKITIELLFKSVRRL